MKKLTRKQTLELKKLHKLIIHNSQTVGEEWYRLARRETYWVRKAGDRQLTLVCAGCFGS